MTRVNLVNVEDLADQHLFAEWREIKMVPAALRRSLKTRNAKDIVKSIPKKYTLNEGHVTFFFDKMNFLYDRYVQLTEELINRNYNIQMHDMDEIFYTDIPLEFRETEWQPNIDDIRVNVERIVIRLNEKAEWYKYYGKNTEPRYFEELYKLYK